MSDADTRPGGEHLRGTAADIRRLQRPLPAVAASARLARMTARAACRAWRVPEAGDAAALLASELVTTALQHESRGQLTLRMLLSPRRLRLELHDPSGRLSADPVGEHEACCSVRVVAGTSVRWGVEPHGGGRQLWAELALPVSG